MARSLRDMVVIITGASAGIGQALARQLSPRGARLVLAARRLDRLESLNASLGGQHLCVRCDVSVTEDCRRLITAASGHFGRIDTLVCNAGYGLLRTIADTTPAEMREIFTANVFGTTDCIRFAVSVMKGQSPRSLPDDKTRGQIMIVSSAAARRGLPYFGGYSATKAAQLSIAEALRVELKPLRIAVTSVHPIGTSTDFFSTAETHSGAVLHRGKGMQMRQSSETVAKKMMRAIVHPQAELWPFHPARWGLNVAVMLPRLVDHFMGMAQREMEKANARPPSPPSERS